MDKGENSSQSKSSKKGAKEYELEIAYFGYILQIFKPCLTFTPTDDPEKSSQSSASNAKKIKELQELEVDLVLLEDAIKNCDKNVESAAYLGNVIKIVLKHFPNRKKIRHYYLIMQMK